MDFSIGETVIAYNKFSGLQNGKIIASRQKTITTGYLWWEKKVTIDYYVVLFELNIVNDAGELIYVNHGYRLLRKEQIFKAGVN